MSSARELDLGVGVLDHQLVDCEGRRCGNVDDLEVEGLRAGEPRVAAILVGAPVWRGRDTRHSARSVESGFLRNTSLAGS